MAKFITPCSTCLGESICKRASQNIKALDSKVLRSNDLPGDRVAVKVNCDEYSCIYTSDYSTSAASSTNSVKKRVWHTERIPCEQCRFKELCSVDFDKQEAFCLGVRREFDGFVEVSCSCYELYGDRE